MLSSRRKKRREDDVTIPMVFSLRSAEDVRTAQTAQMQRKVKKMYEDMAKDIRKELRKKGHDKITRVQLTLLQRDMETRARQIANELSKGIKNSMTITANEVVQDTQTFLIQCGFKASDVSKAFLYVPDRVVRNIVNGTIYQPGWSLDKAIWGHTVNFNDKISEIVARGVASGKGAYDVAKDLEIYVNPSEAKQARQIKSWIYHKDRNGNWIYERNKDGTIKTDSKGNPIKKRYTKVYNPGVVDYNALRLARTMISHAYQQSFEIVNRKDPFVVGYRWLTSDFHGRVCPVCQERAETDQYGLGEGVFPKDELPLDHPNGMCTFEAVIPYEPDEIGNMIGDWYNAPSGTYPDIDEYAKEFGYEF